MYQARFRVDNEVAVVTGGGRGIGLACAEALGESGARVVIIEPDEQIGSAGRDALTAKGYAAELMLGDVTSSAQMTEIADTLAARGMPASILVNNAGVGSSGISS
ncbi:MAG: SDR family NAD(P)-dependent oxidoreductase, partial [Mesorhizobium sp.]